MMKRYIKSAFAPDDSHTFIERFRSISFPLQLVRIRILGQKVYRELSSSSFSIHTEAFNLSSKNEHDWNSSHDVSPDAHPHRAEEASPEL
jgi:hypothetical protein